MINNLDFFGTISYNGIETADIFHDFNKFYKNIESNYILKEYSIKNSPRPELLSQILYGTTKYYWVLILINKVYDPFYDWIMSEQSVHEYTAQKYQYTGGPNAISYHESSDGEKFWNVVSYPDAPNIWYDRYDETRSYPQFKGSLVPVTNIEHELNENEKRRVINIIQPKDIKNFVNEYNREMELVNVGNN